MSIKTLVTGLEMVKVNALNNVVVSWKLVEEGDNIGLYIKNSAVLECPYIAHAGTAEERENRYQETVDAFMKTPNWGEVTKEHELTDPVLWPVSEAKFEREYTLVASYKTLASTNPTTADTKAWLIPMIVVAAVVGVAGAICYSQKK